VHLFVALAAPHYDDDVYLQCYRFLGALFHENAGALGALLRARTEHEVIAIFRGID
jgi:hypothetical protein